MAQLIAKGRIALANDPITAGLIVADTLTRAAVGTVVSPLVSEAIAQNPTIAAAGAAAATAGVASAINAQDLVKGSSPRLPRLGDGTGGYRNEFGQRIAFPDVDNFWNTPRGIRFGPGGHRQQQRTIPGYSKGTIGANGRIAQDALDESGKVPLGTLAEWAARGPFGVNPRPKWAGSKPFDPKTAFYNLNAVNMRKWTDAMARCGFGTGVARLVFEGTSITHGAGASPTGSEWYRGYPGQLRTMLETYTGRLSGTGMQPLWNSIWGGQTSDARMAWGAGAVQVASPNGPATTPPFYGILGRGGVQLTNNTGTGWFSFLPTTAVASFSIYALADPGGTGLATVKIDGTSVGTFSVDAVASGGTLTRRTGTASNVIIVDVPVTSGIHTLRVEGPAASTVTLYAVKGSTGFGIEVSNFGRSSSRVDEIILDDPTNHYYGMSLHFDAEPADLHVLEMGMNNRNETSAVFVPKARTAITRALASGANVLLLADPEPDYTDAAVGTASLQPRTADLYTLADEFNIPVLDLTWSWPDWATANAAGFFKDHNHPSNIGLWKMAHALFNITTIA